MAGDCCCADGLKIILACSGASNVGQITNEVAKKLDIEKQGKYFCLAGVGGHVSGMIASIEGTEHVLVIDGCSVACAKKAMDAAELNDYKYLVVTELGIEKNHDFTLNESDIEQVMDECKKALNNT